MLYNIMPALSFLQPHPLYIQHAFTFEAFEFFLVEMVYSCIHISESLVGPTDSASQKVYVSYNAALMSRDRLTDRSANIHSGLSSPHGYAFLFSTKAPSFSKTIQYTSSKDVCNFSQVIYVICASSQYNEATEQCVCTHTQDLTSWLVEAVGPFILMASILR